MSFKGKTVIVTGAGRGIGRGIALEFGKEGANVVVCDIDHQNAQKVVSEIGEKGRALALETDITKADQVNDAVEKVIKEFGGIDVLVNNAGVTRVVGSIDKVTEEDWDRTMDTNLKSMFLWCRAVGKQMIKQSSGVVVNISSGAAVLSPNLYEGAYSASKAGVIQLTRQIALEWAKYNIRANAISPGPIDGGGCQPKSKAWLEARLKSIPLNRLGRPEDVAKAAVFLASDNASFITGQVLPVDGGGSISVYYLVQKMIEADSHK